MQRNVGKRDGQIRLVFGVAFLILAALLNEINIVAVISALVGVVLLWTGLTHRCPAYSLFGISTRLPDEHPTRF